MTGQLRKVQLGFSPLNPATAFDAADTSTHTLRKSTLTLTGDSASVLNPFLLLPDGVEERLDPTRFPTIADIRANVSSSEVVNWQDSRAWQFASFNADPYVYDGSILLDNDNILRAFVLTSENGVAAADYTPNLRFYEFVSGTQTEIPSITTAVTPNDLRRVKPNSLPDSDLQGYIEDAAVFISEHLPNDAVKPATLTRINLYVAASMLSARIRQSTSDKVGDKQSAWQGWNTAEKDEFWQRAVALDSSGALVEVGKPTPSLYLARSRRSGRYPFGAGGYTLGYGGY